MTKIQRFEDIEAWQHARILSKEIFKTTNLEQFSRDFSFKDQIRRAVGSVMDNIAEGFERNGNKEFMQFLYISKGSNGEIRSQLYRALDYGYIDQQRFDELYSLSKQTGIILYKLIQYLKKSELKGDKFK